mgnify:CR=1 FL=1|tara:strand:+ start:61 stop:801 length:741 start_codon:yes stop_codon:yes gene_type:complete
MKREVKDRTYRLLRGSVPLAFVLPSKHTRRSPLLYFDEEKNENRVLRYATNQRSPFEDEQDGNAILSPIIFEDGFLAVPRTNPVLQEFLHYHPLNGKKFEEIDNEKDAQQELDYMVQEVDALQAAKDLTIEQAETLGRVLLGKDVSRMTTAELRRDLLVYARRDATAFLNAITNPELQLISKVRAFLDGRLLTLRKNGREVYYNLKDNKKKLTSVPFGEDATEYLASFFKTDDGVEILSFLEKQLD